VIRACPEYPVSLRDILRRGVPADPRYHERLTEELRLVEKHGLEPMFMQVRQILDLMPDVPHNIRGSAGSSLLCYLLGITEIDPIAWEIPVTRFMHDLRPDAPDIDIDVPYNRREEVFERVFKKYGNRVARVSNKVHRDGEFHHWSLHCGGIIIMDDAIPSDMLLRDGQLRMDKNDVEKAGFYKIDLLSSRALAQLNDISDRPLFDYPKEDELTAQVLSSGKSIGIIGGESPAFRKAATSIGVKRMEDAMLATSLIRPAAAEDKRSEEPLVYEDDVISAIAKACRCSPDIADAVRRAIVKGKGQEVVGPDGEPILKDAALRKRVEAFRAYAFCKSHGVAYGAVVWALAYHKARDPERFWKSTLAHAHSMYRPWVHPHEASPYLSTSPKQEELFQLDSRGEWKKFGYWTSAQIVPGAELFELADGSDRWRFCGPIAASRVWYSKKDQRKLTFLTIGVGPQTYINVTVPFGLPAGGWTAAEGVAKRGKTGEFTATLVRECYLGGPVRRRKK
jgi:error-prone DNA polymerase